MNKILDNAKSDKSSNNDEVSNVSNIVNIVSNEEEPAVSENPKSSNTKSNRKDNELSYFKEEINEEIEALKVAKNLKQDEYTELLEFEKELIKFVSIINEFKNKNLEQEKSHIELQEAQKKKAAENIEESENSNNEKLEYANENLENTEKNIADKEEALNIERTTEQEQYTYEQNKKQKIEDDEWADELAKREEAISKIKAETADLQADIDSKTELVAELNAKIDELPSLIEKAKAEGATEKEKELGREYGYKTNMAKKDADVKAQSLQKQIDRLKADYDAVLSEKTAIQEKLDKAREESNKLQMATVQSTGGVKILNNSDKI